MPSNKNNQPYFVVRASAFPKDAADGHFTRSCDQKGNLKTDGTWRIVRFGARAGALVAAAPAKERDAIVVASVLAARQNRERGLGTKAGLVDMVAYLMRDGIPETKEAMQELVDSVKENRARLRKPGSRTATAKAIVSGE